jgi:hypothetical protein
MKSALKKRKGNNFYNVLNLEANNSLFFYGKIMLITEDGTGLPTADSYISLIDARAYALKYGYTLPVDDDQADIFMRKAVIYVDLFEASFSGERLEDTQALAWPRVNAYKCSGRHQIDLPSDSVPIEIQHAQVIAAHYYAAGVNVRANDDGLGIASEEVVGSVKVAYFDNGKTGATIDLTEADDMLANLLCFNNGLTLQTVRV